MRNLLQSAWALTFLCLCTTGCNLGLGLTAAKPLDDAQIERYLRAYRNVRALVPDLGPPSADMQALRDLGAINLSSIDDAVQKAGLSGHQEFLLLSAKVGTALGVIEAKDLGQDMGKKVDAGRAELEKALRSPNLPADAKAKLLAQLEATQGHVEDGKIWANKLLAFVDSFSSDSSQATVRRHREALRAAFR